jgi:hypothetical protein
MERAAGSEQAAAAPYPRFPPRGSGLFAGRTGAGVPAGRRRRQSIHAARQSLDGQGLFFLAQDLGAAGRDFVAKNTGLYVMPAAGGDATLLSDAENMELGTDGRIELRAGDNALVIRSEDDPCAARWSRDSATSRRSSNGQWRPRFWSSRARTTNSHAPAPRTTASSDPGMVGPPPSDDGESGARRHP